MTTQPDERQARELRELLANVRPWLVRLLNVHDVDVINWHEHEHAAREIVAVVIAIAARAEREAVLQFMRSKAVEHGDSLTDGELYVAHHFADAIERADHLPQRGEAEDG